MSPSNPTTEKQAPQHEPEQEPRTGVVLKRKGSECASLGNEEDKGASSGAVDVAAVLRGSSAVIAKSPDEYVQIVKAHQDVELIRWCLGIMTSSVVVFLGAFLLWGFGLLPTVDESMMKWFGGCSIGVVGTALGTIIASRFRNKG